MISNTIRYATMLAIATAVISGTNNFLTKIAVTAVKDPIVFTTLKNAAVAVFLVGLILIFKKWPEIVSLTKVQILKLLAIGAVGGSIPFALYFTGLSQTSAVNAALIHKTLFLWVLLLAIPILKERLTAGQWLGVAAIFAANLLVGGFTGFKYNFGELMILAATILWAIENIIAKIVLKDVSSMTVAAARMTIGSLLLLLLVFWQGKIQLVSGLSSAQWQWTLLTSVLLLGYVLSWYTALKYAPASYVAALLVPATLVTNILSAIFVTHSLTLAQISSSTLFIIGMLLMIFSAKKVASAVAQGQRPKLKPLS